MGPYARTQLNNASWISSIIDPAKDGEDKQLSEQRSIHLMQHYFKLVNTHMHGVPGGKVESESFNHDFRLPQCYDIPKFREFSKGSKEESG